MAATSIEWCDHSINPIRATRGDAVGHYCEKISPGCANCYASTLQKRFRMPAFPGRTHDGETGPLDGSTKTGVVPYLDETKLAEVLRRKKPTRYFWADMNDLFGWWVRDEWLDKCFATMALTSQHTHLVLTKRPERMHDCIARLGRSIEPLQAAARSLGYSLQFEFGGRKVGLVPWPLPNAWLGASAESEAEAVKRHRDLGDTPAAVRFWSLEPLIKPIDAIPLKGISWVIVGGESGNGSRPCNTQWIRSIVDQCAAAGVACFVKQLGSVPYTDDSHLTGAPLDMANLTRLPGAAMQHRKGGDISEWPEYLRVRQFPAIATGIDPVARPLCNRPA